MGELKDRLINNSDAINVKLNEQEFAFAKALQQVVQYDVRGRRLLVGFLALVLIHRHPKFELPKGKAAQYSIDLDNAEKRLLKVDIVDDKED